MIFLMRGVTVVCEMEKIVAQVRPVIEWTLHPKLRVVLRCDVVCAGSTCAKAGAHRCSVSAKHTAHCKHLSWYHGSWSLSAQSACTVQVQVQVVYQDFVQLRSNIGKDWFSNLQTMQPNAQCKTKKLNNIYLINENINLNYQKFKINLKILKFIYKLNDI